MNHRLVIICTLLLGAGCQRADRQDQPPTSPPIQTAPQGTSVGEPSRAQPDITSPGSTADERVNTSGRDEQGTIGTGSNNMEHGDTRSAGTGGGSGSGGRTSGGSGGSGASSGRGQQSGDTSGNALGGSAPGSSNPGGHRSGSARD